MEQRLCKTCEEEGKIEIEDEYHVLLRCPKYWELRRKYIDYQYYTNVTFDKFISIMSSEDYSTLRNLSLFVFHAFKLIE